jgi:membrane protease YdiL (CAAX protease family)
VFFVITGIGWRHTGARFGEVFPLRPFDPRLLAPVFLFTLGSVAVLSQLDSLLRLLPSPDWWDRLLRMIDQAMLDMIRESYWPSVIALVVMAPITEELFFRGFVLRGFRLRYTKKKAIVLSALLFAITHATPNQFLSAFAIGLFLAWIVLETGSLWPALFVHAVGNGSSVLAVGAGMLVPPGVEQPELLPWWTTLAGLAALAGGAWWLRRLLRARSPAL